jgi:hypothetical protein
MIGYSGATQACALIFDVFFLQVFFVKSASVLHDG